MNFKLSLKISNLSPLLGRPFWALPCWACHLRYRPITSSSVRAVADATKRRDKRAVAINMADEKVAIRLGRGISSCGCLIVG